MTMTIGGNDENVFAGSFFGACAAAHPATDLRQPVRDADGSGFTDAIRTQTYPNLVAALTAVRKKAPRRPWSSSGYPGILPTRSSPACTGSMPIAMGDVP